MLTGVYEQATVLTYFKKFLSITGSHLKKFWELYARRIQYLANFSIRNALSKASSNILKPLKTVERHVNGFFVTWRVKL